jgi:hypothetical protein
MKAEQPITPDQAIVFAINCEKNAAELHYKKAITVANPKIAGLMKSLGQRDGDHFSLLASVARERGIPYDLVPEKIIVPHNPKVKKGIRIK